jgi:predicted anti-sigma-YlaC factor YlaD
MMTCKEVSMLISAGGLSDAPFARRLAVRLHLAMCRHCRAFRRQVEAVASAARAAGAALEAEPPHDFESKIAQRLRQ